MDKLRSAQEELAWLQGYWEGRLRAEMTTPKEVLFCDLSREEQRGLGIEELYWPVSEDDYSEESES